MLTIKPAKQKNYYKVFLDEEYIGCIPVSFLPAEYFVEPDTKFSDEFIQILKDFVYKNAINKLVWYLSKMEKTVYDCKLFLKKHDFPEPIISEVIKEAENKNWLSNERYATLYVEEAILTGRSPLEIKHKLLQKKIDVDTINKALKEFYTDEKKDDVLENMIDSIIKRYSDKDTEKLFEKVATALYRKGFQYNDYEELLRKKILQIF